MLHKCIKDRFPSIKLFYEKNSYKKVNSDYYLAIPYGKKYFAWFTYINNENVCLLIEIRTGRDGSFSLLSSSIISVSFHNDLSLNTIFFGTLIPNSSYFCIEDIYYYKNEKVTNKSNKDKLKLFDFIFKNELSQEKQLIPSQIIFGLPLISNSFKWINNEIKTLPYKIYSIHCKNFTNNNSFKIIYKYDTKDISNKKIFSVKATIGVDNYQLLNVNNNEFVSIAYIPNYKISKLMNSIFRTIKENDNLDALEESDDEEEFENTNEDKYVDLNKIVKMECELHPSFKKWVPIKLLS